MDPKSVETIKLNDLNTKMEVARNIVRACKKEHKLKQPYAKHYNRLQYYTEIDPSMIDKATREMRREKPFLSWVQKHITHPSKFELNRNEIIRKIIYTKYVLEGTVPTEEMIYDELNVEYSDKISKEDIPSVLKIAGYYTARLPGYPNKSIIIEDPDIVFKRMNYLEAISKYRLEKRIIYYIDERNYTESNVCEETYICNAKYLIIIANDKGVQKLVYNQSFVDDTMLIQLLLNTDIPLNSVIVLPERQHYTKISVPAENSLKHKMIEWLAKNCIPHDPEMHRAQLYALIEKSKRRFKPEQYRLDEMLEVQNYKVLRRPFGYPSLNIFNSFFKALSRADDSGENAEKDNKVCWQFKGYLSNAAPTFPIDKWMELERDLIKAENNMYEKDMEMEIVIDQLITAIKDDVISRSAVDKNCNNHPPSNDYYLKGVVYNDSV